MTQTLEIKTRGRTRDKTLSLNGRNPLILDRSFYEAEALREGRDGTPTLELRYQNPQLELVDEAEKVYRYLGGDNMADGNMVCPGPDTKIPTVAISGDYEFRVI